MRLDREAEFKDFPCWSSGLYQIPVWKFAVRTLVNGLCARALELPLLVRSGVFILFFCLSRGADF